MSTKRPCRFGSDCTRPECIFSHPHGRQHDLSASRDKPPSSERQCRNGDKCYRQDCKFSHPPGWFICREHCVDFHCSGAHPEGRLRSCHSAQECYNPNCTFLHPPSRFICEETCSDFHCKGAHPKHRTRLCKFGKECRRPDCRFLHPEQDRVDPQSAADSSLAALNKATDHDPSQSASQTPKVAKRAPTHRQQSSTTKNRPIAKIPLGIGVSDSSGVQDKAKSKRGRPIVTPQVHGASHVNKCAAGQVKLRTEKERAEYRKVASLPIFASQDKFIKRLREEKVLVVTAETGSGKTTQLPQYAAEAFDGLVVCTQPRALAAISIAQRIASEFDGAKTGHNVGYRVGGGKEVKGKRIMLMTDAALVQRAQRDAKLSDVSVLIIDEAHERSLNTDLVVGISKLVREQRPDDFYIVIASATIDPKPFLDFFFPPESQQQRQTSSSFTSLFSRFRTSLFRSTVSMEREGALNVPGRTFPVALEHRDIDDDNVLNIVVDEVAEALERHTEGHCLVFLPGSNEVDRSVKQFQSLAMDNYVALPLYGSLPPEEQQRIMEFDDPERRMVIFCTNVAETSLTVPNVRLVVDTGLAKEARYDPKRRLTVLELVYVSQSSADQRKGRAGRTAPGHCIRLYPAEKITRPNIEPEILRSSLDLVVLQLRRLGYNPLTFPLMDRPSEEFLHASISLLSEFGCLKQDSVTKRGVLFSEMPFDPRMSHFVTTAHELFNKLRIASEIAAILTAPGAIFFMGGSDKNAKEAAKQRIAEGALKYESDLLHLHQTYMNWLNAGKGKKHKDCMKHRIDPDGCKSCRSKYAGENSLNNKVLDAVRRTSQLVENKLKNYGRKGTNLLETGRSAGVFPIEEIIGRCLVTAFKEQVCEFLLPRRPDAGVLLLDSGSRGTISSQSSLAQLRESDQGEFHIIAMSVTQIPSGKVIVEKAHPLSLEWLSDSMRRKVRSSSLNIVECYSRPNVGARFESMLMKHLQEHTEVDASFIIPMYDAESVTLRVFGPSNQRRAIQCICDQTVQQAITNELEYEHTVSSSNGDVMITVIAGMVVEKVEQAGLVHRVRFHGSALNDVHDDKSFKEWLLKHAKIKSEEIKWLHYYNNSESDSMSSNAVDSYGIAVFTNEKAADTAKEAVARHTSNEETASSQFTQAEEWGRCVLWKISSDASMEEMTECLRPSPIVPKKIQKRFSKLPSYRVEFSDIPESVSQQEILSYAALPSDFVGIWMDSRFGTPTRGNMKFTTATERNAAYSALLASPIASMRASITTKRGKMKMVSSKLSCKDIEGESEYFLVFGSPEDADSFVQGFNSSFVPSLLCHSPEGHSSVFIKHRNLFNIDQLKLTLQSRYPNINVQEERISKKDSSSVRIRLSGPSPTECGQAAQALSSATAPLHLRLSSRQQQVFFTELYDFDMLDELAEELNLRLEARREKKKYKLLFALFVHGDQTKQGMFMAKVGEYNDAFVKRYALTRMDKSTASHFRWGRAGSKWIKEFNQKFHDQASVDFLPWLDSIELYVFRNVSTAKTIQNNFKKEFDKFLKNIGGTQLSDAATACAYCNQRSSAKLIICGHHYCLQCLRDEAIHAVKSGQLSILCGRCQQRVSVRDLRNVLYDTKLAEIATTAACAHLKQQRNHPLGLCPISHCTGIIAKKYGYSACPSCSHSVCSECGVCDDDVHLGRSCAEYIVEHERLEEKKRLEEEQRLEEERRHPVFLRQILTDAQEFVRQKWSIDLPKIVDIQVNPGLASGCNAIQRFCRALRRLNLSLSMVMQQGAFFAWHGTPSDAGFVGICDEGFDPKRRRGQAYGPGEYFGHTAGVSRGYSGSSNRMIVALLLRVQELSTHNNFCYVVNNPTTWEYSYCLPVLVLTYAQLPPLKFVIIDPPRSIHLDQDDAATTMMVKSHHWTSPFRWSWMTDGGSFEPYPDFTSNLIEEHYSAYQNNEGSSSFITPPIVRYIDDTPQEYKIDFVNNIQINMKTRYNRRIQRRQVDVETQFAQWQVLVNAQWIPFEFLVQGQIDRVYRAYMDNLGPGVVRGLQFPGRPEPYSLDVVKGQQTNEQTGTVRQIRRVPLSKIPSTRKSSSSSTLNPSEEKITIQLPSEISSSLISRAWQVLTGLEQHLTSIAEKACGNRISRGSIRFVVTDISVELSLSGPVRNICAMLVGRIQAALHQHGIKTGACITASGSFGAHMLQNPRLLQLLTPLPPMERWYTRDDAMLLLAHALVWQAKCTIYGGFVRDWVILNESANDIDTLLPNASPNALNEAESRIVSTARALNMVHVGSRTKGMAYALEFRGSWSGKSIEVDLVTPSNSKRSPPYVDTDVGNLCISETNGLSKKVPNAGEPMLDIAKCISHTTKKRFVLLYDPVSNAGECSQRLDKYLSRGWTCLSKLPPSLHDELTRKYGQHLLRPKSKYAQEWWAQ